MLIGHTRNHKGEDYFQLTPKGISEAANHLSLKEARKSGIASMRQAKISNYFAGTALLLACVGFVFTGYSIFLQKQALDLANVERQTNADAIINYTYDNGEFSTISANVEIIPTCLNNLEIQTK